MKIKIDKFKSTRKVSLGKNCGYFPVTATANGKNVPVHLGLEP